MDEIDRRIVNELQGGFPLCPRPFAAVATHLGVDETTLIARLDRLLAEGVLTRFGPLYNAERMGGGLTLVAMKVPPERFEAVAAIVNEFPEVAHNYAREHDLNMWFVVATETPERVGQVLAEISNRTGLATYDMPKQAEFFLTARFEA